MANSGLLTNNSSVSFKIGDSANPTEVIPGLQSIPSLGGDIEQIDITCLSDTSFHYMNGLRDYGDFEFTFLYIPKSEMGTGATGSNYELVKEHEADGTSKYVDITIGDGTVFHLQGTVAASLNEAGVNEAFTFTVKIGLSADIEETPAA